MEIETLIGAVQGLGVSFYTGVPDSQLKALCDYLMCAYGVDPHTHIVAANEGAAIGLAAGHTLATGRPSLVYMQNSGIGNAVNPIASLLDKRVYAIPMLFVIGWRGEPGVHDEPQHVFQGEITLPLLDTLEIGYAVIDKAFDELALEKVIARCKAAFSRGECFALVVKKGALQYAGKPAYTRDAPLSREEAVRLIIAQAPENAVFVSTTGKLSRELFELREQSEQGHGRDFLTVGSMGHSLMIAAGIAAEKPDKAVYCLDGDGAMLMHMGSVAVAGRMGLRNLTHIVILNGAHETVGGVPNVADGIDIPAIARACGYASAVTAETEDALNKALRAGAQLIAVRTNLQVRADLGRPTTTPVQNKLAFMATLSGGDER